MIPLAVPNLSGNEKKYLDECIDSTFVSSVGTFVNRLEEECATVCVAQYAVAVSSGTTGLLTALLSCGVKSGDLVIIPSFTFIATANAIKHCGASPWIMDIDNVSWTIDIEQIEQELRNETQQKDGECYHIKTGKRVSAIMPVYTLGVIPDMKKINKIAKEFGLRVIADAACAIGSTYENSNLSDLADVTVFSFNGNKTVTAGGGGMLVGNDEEIMRLAKHLSTTARVGSEYDFDMVGYNFRMTNIQAAVGVAQMEQLPEFVEKKRYIRGYYYNSLCGKENLGFFPDGLFGKSSCWFSGVVIKNGNIDLVRQLCKRLRDNGVEGRAFWKPIHMQKPYIDTPTAERTLVSENIWDKILTLPCSTGITENELEYVVKVVKEIL